jgi:tetratricopeptide (TPR) repeat protein
MSRRILCLWVLLAALCGSASASTDQWLEVRSPHFTLFSDSNEKQARHIVDQFERMRWMFQTLFPKHNVDPVAPIIVIACKSSKCFEALEPEGYLAKGQMKLGGLFMRGPDKNYVLLRLDAEQEHPFAAVYHEYTHLQFSDDGEWMPLWLNEGTAEFVQNTEIHDKQVQLGEPSTDDILYLRQNRLIPLPVLFKVDAKSPYYHDEQKGSVFYAESWALTHYLYMNDRQMHTDQVGEYMTLVSRHEDPAAAAEKAFGDLKKLQSALEEYIQRSNYKYFILSSAAAPIDESTYSVRPLPQTESDAVRADSLAYVQRNKDARALLDSVMKADPNNAQARETLGMMEFRAGNREAAQKWFAEAVKLGSQNYMVHYYFASLDRGREQGAAEMKEIESSLRACIRLNPGFAPAYDQLSSYLMSLERFDDAKAVLQDAVKNARTPRDAALAQRKISQLDQMQAMQAKAEAAAKARIEEETVETTKAVEESAPKHPSEPPNGPKHELLGVIHGVQCSYPAVIEFRVQGAKKTVSLYSNDYYKLDFTVLGFTPQGSLNPCTGIEGMNARVQYAESSDKTVDGQAIAVELRK